MKGAFLKCMHDMISLRYGESKWQQIIETAGIPKTVYLFPTVDLDESIVRSIINSACKVLGINLIQIADSFGEFWMNSYAPKIYDSIYKRNKTAKDFLLNIDNIHMAVQYSMKGSEPPRFKYEWKDDNTLIMKYISKRGLLDFAVGFIKGVAKYYKEDIKVKKIVPDQVEIMFNS